MKNKIGGSLRPFLESDPPHMCESLTCNATEFAYQYILEDVYKRQVPMYQKNRYSGVGRSIWQ